MKKTATRSFISASLLAFAAALLLALGLSATTAEKAYGAPSNQVFQSAGMTQINSDTVTLPVNQQYYEYWGTLGNITLTLNPNYSGYNSIKYVQLTTSAPSNQVFPKGYGSYNNLAAVNKSDGTATIAYTADHAVTYTIKAQAVDASLTPIGTPLTIIQGVEITPWSTPSKNVTVDLSFRKNGAPISGVLGSNQDIFGTGAGLLDELDARTVGYMLENETLEFVYTITSNDALTAADTFEMYLDKSYGTTFSATDANGMSVDDKNLTLKQLTFTSPYKYEASFFVTPNNTFVNMAAGQYISVMGQGALSNPTYINDVNVISMHLAPSASQINYNQAGAAYATTLTPTSNGIKVQNTFSQNGIAFTQNITFGNWIGWANSYTVGSATGQAFSMSAGEVLSSNYYTQNNTASQYQWNNIIFPFPAGTYYVQPVLPPASVFSHAFSGSLNTASLAGSFTVNAAGNITATSGNVTIAGVDNGTNPPGTGTPVTPGWHQDSLGQWTYANSAGKNVTDWQKIDGKWYYFNTEGIMLSGWQLIDNTWYYLGSANSGMMVANQWVKSGGLWYFLGASGAMATNQWVKSGGLWYYVTDTGVMATNSWIGDYYVDSSGAWTQTR